MAEPTRVELNPHHVKAVLMAILFAGAQIATELARAAKQPNKFSSIEDLKQRADRIWTEGKK